MKHAIAVLVPNPGTGPARSEWGRYVTLGALDSVRGGGHHVVTLNADALSDADLAPLVAARPKGVLMPELIGEAHLVHQAAAAFHAAGIPVVVYGDDPRLAGYDRVVSDHESGSWILTKALLELGRRPARFWRQPHDVWWLGARSLGYARAMTEAGQRPLGILGYPSIATHHASREGFEDSVRQLAGFLIEALRGPQRVDALMVTSDRDAFYAAAAVRLIGLRPGRDVLIAGYDNYHHLCEERQFQPLTPLLTIDKRNELMGREMLSLLNDRIANASLARPIVRRIPPELVRTGI
jgi:LacI family transcriptional regulator